MPQEPSFDGEPPRTWVAADYLYFLVERLWIILLVLIAFEVFGFFRWSKTPDTFASSATIEVLLPMRDTVSVDPLEQYRFFQQTQTIVAAMEAKLSQYSLFEAVVTRPEFSGLLSSSPEADEKGVDDAKVQLAQKFLAATQVFDQDRTQMLVIRTVYEDPETAQKVVTAILDELRISASDKRAGSSSANIEQLNKEIEEIRNRLSLAEESLSIYSRALEITKEIRASEGRILEMQKIYLDQWPALVQERQHLALLSQTLESELNRIIRSVESEKAFWDSKEAQKTAISPEELIAFQVSNIEARHNMINRDFSSDSKLYDSLLDKVKMGDIAIEFEQQEFSILQPPSLNPRSLRLTPWQVALNFGWKGLLAGVALAFLVSRFDSTLKRVDDLERHTNLPIFSVVPQCLSLANDKDSRKGAGTDARATSESFRTLLASSNLFHPEARTILITSSIPGEGKSTISCHFAAAEIEADPEKQVIVVDLDLRRPRIGEYLQLDNDHPGVYEVLAGKATLKEAIQKTDDGYDVIAAGKTPGRNVLPNEALIEKLLTVLQKKYDRIIIDSAPRLAVSDTLIISRHVDMLCLVFRMWKTPRKALSRAIGRLEQNQTLPAGVVANYMPAKKLLGQANYYYSYSNAGYSQYSS